MDRREFLMRLGLAAAGISASGMQNLAASEPLLEQFPATLMIGGGGPIVKPGLWADLQRCGATFSTVPVEYQDVWKFLRESIRQTGKENPNIVVITAAAGAVDINEDEAELYGQNYTALLRSLSPNSKVNYIAEVTTGGNGNDLICANNLN